MTSEHVTNPWNIVAALLPASDGMARLAHQIVISAPALKLQPMIDEAPQAVEAVLDFLLQKPDQAPSDWHAFALLDAARSRFLPERLETSGLGYCCLYDLEENPQLGETAPWLVELDPDKAFTRATLAHDETSHDPRQMLGDGIFLAGPLGLDDMRRHLKRYTALQDELGIRQFFRLQEPGMLDALFCVATDTQRADFFAGAPRMVYPRPALEAGKWDFVSVSFSSAGQARGDRAPVVDATARKALALFVNDRKARRLAVSDIPDEAERPAASWTFARLMHAGFDYPPRLVEAFRLLQRCPPEVHPSFWQQVESGRYSLRSILLVFADHYHIEGIFEDVWS